MGRANRAQNGEESPAELMPEIPLDELKQLDPHTRISVVEAHNYMRAGQNARPIVEQGSE